MKLLIIAAALAAAASAPALAAAPQCASDQGSAAWLCRALDASDGQRFTEAAEAFEKAAAASPAGEARTQRMLAAAGNMWIAAGQAGRAALALDRALAGTGLQAEQRGLALLDRARAAEAQNDLKAARRFANQAADSAGEDPFTWYFSAALAIRENDPATAKSAIGKALTLAPTTPEILFEAGHVAQFTGDEKQARAYWTQAEQQDAGGPIGKAAREAIAKLAPAPAAAAAGTPKAP